MKDLIMMAVTTHPALHELSSRSKAFSEMTGFSNYIPDPIVKSHYFVRPIETRNGPHQSNIMLSQSIPWPSFVSSKQEQAQLKGEILRHRYAAKKIELSFQVRSTVLTLIALNAEKNIISNLLHSLAGFREIVVSRIEVGRASQTDAAKINIEIASLREKILALNLEQQRANHKLAELTGKTITEISIPRHFPPSYLVPRNMNHIENTLIEHPIYKEALATTTYQGSLRKEERSKTLPKIAVSLSWMNIEKPDNPSMADEQGKDASSVGLSISVPLWSSLSGRTRREDHLVNAKQMDSQRIALSLKRQTANLSAQIRLADDTRSLYRLNIIPNLQKALEIDRSAYSQGTVSIEIVLRDYTQVMAAKARLVKTEKRLVIANAGLKRLGFDSRGDP